MVGYQFKGNTCKNIIHLKISVFTALSELQLADPEARWMQSCEVCQVQTRLLLGKLWPFEHTVLFGRMQFNVMKAIYFIQSIKSAQDDICTFSGFSLS